LGTRIIALIGIAGVGFALSACAQMAKSEALARARAHCADEGKQFVLKEADTREDLIMSDATVTGYCVGPGDPGYVPPANSAPAARQ